ncbi:hypothetical protein, partial [uncultured Treponema sp.]|uniref:hypothetical protein n=1 Tax=uncultured Treponema sp. TaxID=162155 RepID=UPI00280B8C3B
MTDNSDVTFGMTVYGISKYINDTQLFSGGVIKTLPEIASKFLFTSSRCELPYQLPLLISLRSGIK